jgi:predicted HicB family RNase H-like nuclease
MVANQPKTPHRTIRVDPELWDATRARAAQRGETISAVVHDALERYVAQPPGA